MKTLMLALVALALALPVMAQTQDTNKQSDQTKQNDQNQASTKTDKNMSGTVSKDAKSFSNEKDNKTYSVDNPDALQGHEGQHVAIVVHVDPDNNVIHIIQLEPPQ